MEAKQQPHVPRLLGEFVRAQQALAETPENRWYAGEVFHHSPNNTEAMVHASLHNNTGFKAVRDSFLRKK